MDYGSYAHASVRLVVELANSYDAPEGSAGTAAGCTRGLLADADVIPWMARTPAGREIFFASQNAPLGRRVACDPALGLAMMMTDHAERLKICAAEDCTNVFVDESCYRSRRCAPTAAAAVSTSSPSAPGDAARYAPPLPADEANPVSRRNLRDG